MENTLNIYTYMYIVIHAMKIFERVFICVVGKYGGVKVPVVTPDDKINPQGPLSRGRIKLPPESCPLTSTFAYKKGS